MLSDIFEWTLAIMIVLAVLLIFGAFGVLLTTVMVAALGTYVILATIHWVSSLFPSREPRRKGERRIEDGDA